MVATAPPIFSQLMAEAARLSAERVPTNKLPPGTKRWTAREKPPCYDETTEWLSWFLAAKQAGEPNVIAQGAALPCIDCDPAEQRAMMAAGRCQNGHVDLISLARNWSTAE